MICYWHLWVEVRDAAPILHSSTIKDSLAPKVHRAEVENLWSRVSVRLEGLGCDLGATLAGLALTLGRASLPLPQQRMKPVTPCGVCGATTHPARGAPVGNARRALKRRD